MASSQVSSPTWGPAEPPARGPAVPTGVLVLALVLVFPAGLVLLWTSSEWRLRTRALVTAVVLIVASATIWALSPGRGGADVASNPHVLAPVPTRTPTTPPPRAVPLAIAPVTALAMLSQLVVRDQEIPPGIPPYDRTVYGPAWRDTDGNGCDTRNDVLRRDMTDVVLQPGSGCVVQTGFFVDPYDGMPVQYDRNFEKEVQVDHIVSMLDAWHSGAHAWPMARKSAFANEPLNLRTVSARSNRQKGESPTDGWLPPELSFRCTFAAVQIGVKAKYGLTVTGNERRSLERVLEECLGQPVITGGLPTLAP